MTNPLEREPVNINNYCCADPLAGGCAHPMDAHASGTGACVGVFGCRCEQFRVHKAGCIHLPIQEGGDPA